MEHIHLIKAREDISEHEEKDMLDYLYTFQYHMNGIIAISLGEALTSFLLSLSITLLIIFIYE